MFCHQLAIYQRTELFSVDITQGNSIVKKASDEYRKNQIKTQMYKLWSDKADGTKNPKVWSDRYRIPILCCISSKEYVEAKKAFSVLNSNVHSDSDIKTTIEFLEKAKFFDEIANSSFRDECFVKVMLGEYANVLQNVNAVKDAIEALGYGCVSQVSLLRMTAERRDSRCSTHIRPCRRCTLQMMATQKYFISRMRQLHFLHLHRNRRL